MLAARDQNLKIEGASSESVLFVDQVSTVPFFAAATTVGDVDSY